MVCMRYVATIIHFHLKWNYLKAHCTSTLFHCKNLVEPMKILPHTHTYIHSYIRMSTYAYMHLYVHMSMHIYRETCIYDTVFKPGS